MVYLCNYFKVSYEAMCYRLKTLNYISENECLKFINNNINNFYEEAERKKGGNYWASKLNVLSPNIANSIISELYNGNITYTECFKMLGIKNIKTFKQFKKKLADLTQ